MIRGEWRKGLRSAGVVRRDRGRSFKKMRWASAPLVALLMMTPSAVPMARAAAGRSTVTQRPPGYLGIEFHDLTREQAEALHLRGPQGVEVLLVDHDGPAAAAGLQPHDLITGFNGHMVASGEALRRTIHDAGAGVMVTLSVFRNGNPITIRTKLANREDIERKMWARLRQGEPVAPPAQATVVEGFSESYVAPAPEAAAAPARGQSFSSQGFIGTMLHGPSTGLMVEAMQPQLANYFGTPSGEGLLVESVVAGSAAAVAGVQAGDVILRAGNRPMRSASEWTKQLHENKGKPLTVDLLRDHHELSVTLPAEGKKR